MRHRSYWQVLFSLVLVLLLAACAAQPAAAPESADTTEAPAEAAASEAEAPTGEAGRGGTVTVAVVSAPASLDPSPGEASNEYFFGLAYDSLVHFDFDGQYKPLLATSWEWEGDDYSTFTMELRPDVKFSDGSALDANVVKGWFDLQRENQSVVAANLGIESVEVTGPLSLRLNLAQPNPLIPLFLSRTWLSGVIPCPAAVADPTLLNTTTCGAGPYMLDTENTVTGDTYTYVPNPYYWNPSAIHWDKVILKVVASPQAGLDALRAGQAQVLAPADPTLIETAVAAGLAHVGVPQNVFGLDFLDKSGAIVPALADVRVRQALNYAIDRAALAEALGSTGGGPTSTQFIEGSDGHDPVYDDYYTYDVEKAQALLEEAGYGDGFDVTILSAPILGLDTLAQAVASYWQAVGVNATLENKTSAAEFFGGLLSGEYGVTVAGLGATNPSLLAWNCCFRPGAAWNPDSTDVPELEALVEQLRTTDPADVGPIAQQINAYMTENAWFVPVYSGKLNYLYDPTKVFVPETTGVQPVINIVEVQPPQ